MSYVSGIHAVEALLRDAPERVRVLWLQRNRRDERLAALRALAAERNLCCKFTDGSRLRRIGGAAHQGAVASCQALPLHSEQAFADQFDAWPTPKLFLVLDGVQDPRNLGACLRTAAAAGVQAVLLPKRRSAPLSAAAMKAASGAAERMILVEVGNLVRRLEWLKRLGVLLVGADAGQPRRWSDADLTRSIALIVGNEGAGLRRSTRQTCDELVSIPMAEEMDSLNVSVAAGVLLFEAVRQRAQPPRGR